MKFFCFVDVHLHVVVAYGVDVAARAGVDDAYLVAEEGGHAYVFAGGGAVVGPILSHADDVAALVDELLHGRQRRGQLELVAQPLPGGAVGGGEHEHVDADAVGVGGDALAADQGHGEAVVLAVAGVESVEGAALALAVDMHRKDDGADGDDGQQNP